MASEIQRLNYHTGLFLEEEEFKLEQSYHLIMRRRLNYALFKPGVLYGLELDYTGGVLTVTPGLAVDEFADSDYGTIGREIVLLEKSSPVGLSGFNTGDGVWITINYKDEPTDPKSPTDKESRITEKYVIDTHDTDPGEGTDKILLGKIVIGTDSHSEPAQKAVLRLGGAAPLPTIASINPDSGDQGETLTGVEITGTNLTGATAVTFDPASGLIVSNVTVVDDEHITFDLEIDSGATTGARNFRVSTPAGTVRSENFGVSFTVNAVSVQPVITSLDPSTTTGPVGSPVIINGENFLSSTNVGVSIEGIAILFNATGKDYKGRPDTDPSPALPDLMDPVNLDQEKYFRVVSDNRIEATVPNGVSTAAVDVIVTSDEGPSNAVVFVVEPKPPVPTITWGIDSGPRSAPVGGELIVPGSNFAERVFVLFNFKTDGSPLGEIKKVEGVAVSNAKVRVVVPDGAASGRIKIKTPEGTEVLSNRDFVKL